MRYAQLSVSKSATPTACRQTNRSHKPTEDALGATFEVASVAGLSFVSSSDDDAGGIIRKLVYEQSRLSRSHHVPFLSRPRGETSPSYCFDIRSIQVTPDEIHLPPSSTVDGDSRRSVGRRSAETDRQTNAERTSSGDHTNIKLHSDIWRVR